MNDDRNTSDDALRKVLREWSVDDPLPHNFRASVWERIARADAPHVTPSVWQRLMAGLEHLLSRPAVAAAYVAVVLAGGVTVGHRHARQELAGTHAALSARYIQTVDPYQKPR